MSEQIYRKLQQFLDQFPIGFPPAPSEIEIEILKRLFTEEEAEIAMLLTPFPERAATIAERAEMQEEAIEAALKSMSKKGLVFRVRREGATLYNAAPFMIGLYEYSVKKIDKELATLFRKYYEAAFLDEMGASNVPGFKVIPIEENIPPGTTCPEECSLRWG
jgi:predicted transcriptional regulator